MASHFSKPSLSYQWNDWWSSVTLLTLLCQFQSLSKPTLMLLRQNLLMIYRKIFVSVEDTLTCCCYTAIPALSSVLKIIPSSGHPLPTQHNPGQTPGQILPLVLILQEVLAVAVVSLGKILPAFGGEVRFLHKDRVCVPLQLITGQD